MSHIGYLYLLPFTGVFHNTASKTENITVLINGRKQNVTFVSETTADNKNKQHVPVQHFNAIFSMPRALLCLYGGQNDKHLSEASQNHPNTLSLHQHTPSEINRK